MALLKDSVISGSLRATDTIYSTTNQFRILKVPTTSDGIIYGTGSTGQVLHTNGTSVYWDTITSVGTITSGIWSGTTIALNKGGTGATTAAQAKANLGFGTTSAMNPYISEGSNSAVVWVLGANVTNANNTTYLNKTVALTPYNNGIGLYNVTDDQQVWALSIPVPVSLGGTGATTATAARTNLGLGTAAIYNIFDPANGIGGWTSGTVLIPRISVNGHMEIGSTLQFHTATSADYSAKLTAGDNGLTLNTNTNEVYFTLDSGAGKLQLYGSSSSTGNRGIWLPPHGTDTSGKYVFVVDTNNRVSLNNTYQMILETMTIAPTSLNINAKLANNNVSENKYPGIVIKDTNSLIMGTFQTIVYATGGMETQIYTRNYDTSGNIVSNPVLGVLASKDGTSEIKGARCTYFTIEPPSGSIAYLRLRPPTDMHSSIQFYRAGTIKWSLSCRNSSDAFFGLYNQMTSTWAIKFADSDNTVTLAKALPLASGGTGATNAAGARKNLGLGNSSGNLPVTIAQGGTGATAALAARTNLQAALGKYTTGEVQTGGTWVDGKTIYRYTWSGTKALNNGQVVMCTLPRTPAAIIHMWGIRKRSSDNSMLTIPNAFYSNSGYDMSIMVNSDNQVIVSAGASYGTGNDTFNIIVEYAAT